VLLDRSLGHPQRVRDSRVRTPFGHQRQHLALSCAEDVQWVFDPPGGDELLHERRVDDRSALDHPLQRLHELPHVRDAALQQVAGALAAREQVHRLFDLGVSRQNKDRRVR